MDIKIYEQQIFNSYQKWFGMKLEQDSACVIVAHDGGADPMLNYGNQAALDLWEFSWEEFIKTPSRYTAEADLRGKREQLLAEVERNGFVEGYEGIRVSKSGKRFWIRNVKIWNVVNQAGSKIGQAATFNQVEFI